MFSQTEIQTAIQNAISGNFTSDWNVVGGWNYSSDSVVYSQHRDYLYFTTDGWRDGARRKRVICNMRGTAILSLI
jgi:hypothetical protein